MIITALYSELYQQLEGGETSFLVSEYKKDGSITRELVRESDQVSLFNVTELQLSPHAIQEGSVTRIAHEDDSFVLIERFMAKPRLIILGAGHISLALAQMAHLAEFDTIIYDDRQSFANAQRFPTAKHIFCDAFENLAEHIHFNSSDFIVDVTRGHQHDKTCLEVILAGPEPAYTGMIGSRRRVAIVMNQLLQEGYDRKRVESVHAPIGLKIGAQTPAEIAISIMAQIIEVKRAKRGEATWISGDLAMIEQVAREGFKPEAVVTVLATEGSVPTEIGCKLGMTYEGMIAGSVGGGCSESEAMQTGREVIRNGGWKVCTVDLTDVAEDEGMVCGGTMQILVEKA